MSRNLLIFADGTSMIGGVHLEETTTNIFKLYRATRSGADSPIDRTQQLAFYHAGLGAKSQDSGSLPNPLKALRRLTSLAMGAGITEHVIDCYETILRHYQPGDRIFLFGFSRGAYTVRNLAGVLNLCGIPEYVGQAGVTCARNGAEIRRIAQAAVTIYEHGAGKDRHQYAPEREERALRFRQHYGAWWQRGQAGEDTHKSNVAPYFIGVFDTVAALGVSGVKRWIVLGIAALGAAVATGLLSALLTALFALSQPLAVSLALLLVVMLPIVRSVKQRLRIITHYPQTERPNLYRNPGHILPSLNFRWHLATWRFKFFDRYLDNRVAYARHALSIDERRADFARVPWGVKGDRAATALEGDSAAPAWFQQVWFAGDHSDIGGGHPEQEAGLADISLQWMVQQLEALPKPPLLNRERLQCFPAPSPHNIVQ
ncbi:DUF2235 domain-containing protein [Thiothrix subterranea]|uniref:DUF2235 domain-containing protein n=1 Tax=Thiothrix subterranea TaxID=2735563 RepID=UPI00280BFDD8|nr:DUF2235 domain-containing protein [Thiothrix subterranea]